MKHEMKILVTLGCNSKCSYCYEQYTDTPYDKEQTIPEENIEKLTKFIKKYILLTPDVTPDNRLIIVFYGGECLLYPDRILKIIKELSAFYKKILFCVFTNGILLEKRIPILKEINSIPDIYFLVRISYDYYLQNRQRKERTHTLVRNNIKKLLASGIRAETSSVIDGSNNKFIGKVYDDFKKFYDYLSDSERKYFNSANYNINCFNLESIKNFDFDTEEQFAYIKKENEKGIRPLFHKAKDWKYTGTHDVLGYIYNVYPNGEVYISETSHYIKDKNGKPYDLSLGNYLKDDAKIIIENQKKMIEFYKENKDVSRCSCCSASSVCAYQPWLEINEDYCKIMDFIQKNS